MFVFKAAVVGAGTMGGEIAQTIAAANIPVILKDVEQRFVDTGLARARSIFDRQVEKGRLEAAEADRLFALIEGTTLYDGFGDVDFVIEAVPERIELKQRVFAELDALTPGHAILASNTSALSIAEIGDATLRPEKVVGFHFFYPASVMRLLEVVEGEYTSAETVAAALSFAQRIRKLPIRAGELPGFVVNRILSAGFSEIWRYQHETGAPLAEIDAALVAARAMPAGPFGLMDVLGLDTVLHVAEFMEESYGEKFFVHPQLRALVQNGELGRKSGSGYYATAPGHSPNVAPAGGDSDSAAAAHQELIDRFMLRTFHEACLVLEDGVGTIKDIDLGMQAGAGIAGPFARADQLGLDVVLEQLERQLADGEESFEVPVLLRRLVAQGRLGVSSGQGFYPYPQPDPGYEDAPVKLERRGEIAIAWLDRPPANSLSPDMIAALRRVWDAVQDSGVRALVIASANPQLFCAGADIKAFTQMDAAAGRQLLDDAHGLFRAFEQSSIVTVAAVNALALGGGNELVMATDFRIGAASATFGQPEINLGIIPGFGGTQRLPRLVGSAKALEMNLSAESVLAEEAYDLGLIHRLVPDHELLDTALHWARMLAQKAPLAVAQIKAVSGNSDLDAGIAAEKAAFGAIFASADAREGIAAFVQKRAPKFTGA